MKFYGISTFSLCLPKIAFNLCSLLFKTDLQFLWKTWWLSKSTIILCDDSKFSNWKCTVTISFNFFSFIIFISTVITLKQMVYNNCSIKLLKSREVSFQIVLKIVLDKWWSWLSMHYSKLILNLSATSATKY